MLIAQACAQHNWVSQQIDKRLLLGKLAALELAWALDKSLKERCWQVEIL
jgi:hypothetical protein